jgi:hypothetical protein
LPRIGTYAPVYKAPYSGKLPFSPARCNKLESLMRSSLFQDLMQRRMEFLTDVSGQPNGPFLKYQGFTLKDGRDILCRNDSKKLPFYASKIAKSAEPIYIQRNPSDQAWSLAGYTGSLKMIVGGFNNLSYTMQPHVISIYGVTSRIRFKFLLFPQVSRN